MAIVTVSWLSPVSTTSCWPARNPNGLASRRPVAPTACAPFSVVRSALSAYWSITVARSANEVVTTNVFVYLAVLPAASWSEAVCVCLPTVSRLSGSVFGTMNSPSIVIRRGAAPPAPLLDGVARVAQARIGPQRRQRLGLQDLAVHDRRRVDGGAGQVRLLQRAGQHDVRRRRRRRRIDDARDLHGLRVGALIDLERVAGGAARQAREPDLRVTGAAAGAPGVADVACSVVGVGAHVANGALVSISSGIVR